MTPDTDPDFIAFLKAPVLAIITMLPAAIAVWVVDPSLLASIPLWMLHYAFVFVGIEVGHQVQREQVRAV